MKVNPATIAKSTARAEQHSRVRHIAVTLPPGVYTAIMAGLDNTTGNGLIEVYDRGTP